MRTTETPRRDEQLLGRPSWAIETAIAVIACLVILLVFVVVAALA